MPTIEEDTENLEIDLSNLPEEGDGEEIEVSADDGEDTPEPEQATARPSRKERRGNRVNELLEAERRRADQAERQHQETLRTMQQIAQRPVYAQPAQAPQPQGPDPYEAQAHQLRQEKMMLTRAFNDAHARGDMAAVEQCEQAGWQLAERIEDNNYIRRVRKFGVPQQPQQQGMSPQQIEEMVDRRAAFRRLQEEHGDVVSDERAAKVFQANFGKKIAMGHPDSWDTLTAAIEETRHELRMKPKGGRPAPSAATRARLSGMSTGASGAGASGPRVIKMTRGNRALADATYPHLPEAQRYQKWAREVGAKVPEGA